MNCPKCGLEIQGEEMYCPSCETRLMEFSEEKGMEAAREIAASVSWYSSLARVCIFLSIFIIPAPFALLFGILTLRDIKAHPHKSGKLWGYLGTAIGGLITFFIIIGIIDRQFPGLIK